MSETAGAQTDRANWLRESREAISNGDKEELARHLEAKVRYDIGWVTCQGGSRMIRAGLES